MSALSLISEVKRIIDEGRPIDWRKIRDRVHEEHAAANNSEERSSLLALYGAVMDSAGQNVIELEDLERFREARMQDYNLLLIQESTVDSNVSPRLLDEVTQREITAGRMAPDHKLRELARAGQLMTDKTDAPQMSRAGGWRGAMVRLWRKK